MIRILFLLVVVPFQFIQAQNEFKFNSDDFDKVVIKHASGQIDIKSSELDKDVLLNTRSAVSASDCDSNFEVKDRTLYLTTEKKIFVIKSDCTQDFEFFLPTNKKVSVSLGMGSIHFSGLFPALKADLGSGEITVRGKVSSLDLNVAMGSVSVSGLDGYGKITLLSGDLDIKYKEPEKKFNQLFISKTAGNTSIQVPKGIKAESKLKTLIGNISNTVKSSPESQMYISVNTNAGDISMDSY